MAASKRCPRCPVLIPATSRYCPTHAAEYETKRGSSTQRGYDHKHRAKRREYAARMTRGETFTCHRCSTTTSDPFVVLSPKTSCETAQV